MASHDRGAMPVESWVRRADVVATGATEGVASCGAAVVVDAGRPLLGGGCGSSAAGFGGGALLALPMLVAALLLRRLVRRSARR